jgi:hypothetical protein
MSIPREVMAATEARSRIPGLYFNLIFSGRLLAGPDVRLFLDGGLMLFSRRYQRIALEIDRQRNSESVGIL